MEYIVHPDKFTLRWGFSTGYSHISGKSRSAKCLINPEIYLIVEIAIVPCGKPNITKKKRIWDRTQFMWLLT